MFQDDPNFQRWAASIVFVLGFVGGLMLAAAYITLF